MIFAVVEKGGQQMNKIKYYFFCIKWLWKNRDWANTRQKFKAMEKEYRRRSSRKDEHRMDFESSRNERK